MRSALDLPVTGTENLRFASAAEAGSMGHHRVNRSKGDTAVRAPSCPLAPSAASHTTRLAVMPRGGSFRFQTSCPTTGAGAARFHPGGESDG